MTAESSSKLSSPSPSHSDASAGDESTKTLNSILAALPLPPGGVKRKYSGDGHSATLNPPSKVHKSGMRIVLHGRIIRADYPFEHWTSSLHFLFQNLCIVNFT